MLIEPLDPTHHDRSGFSSGTQQVDNYFRKTANKLAQAGNLRVFVMLSPENALIGFYALNAHTIDFRDLPSRFARTRPGHGQIPAVFISMIGVDVRFQGKGYGGDLVADCLKRIYRIARDLGIAMAMLDVLDCGDPSRVERRKALYARYGFRPLPDHPLRLFLPIATIAALMDAR